MWVIPVVIVAVLLALAPSLALAVKGTLKHWETEMSPTGRLVYVCYYNVMGSTQRVVLKKMCPVTMDFD